MAMLKIDDLVVSTFETGATPVIGHDTTPYSPYCCTEANSGCDTNAEAGCTDPQAGCWVQPQTADGCAA